MSSADDYRINAEDCLRMAKQASEERDRPLWATMALSWLRLAEHAERVTLAPELAVRDEDHTNHRTTLAPQDPANEAEGSALAREDDEETSVPHASH